MKIFYGSDYHLDVHLEDYGKQHTLTTLGVDIEAYDAFVFAGDTVTDGHPDVALPMFQELQDAGKPAFVILGNHCHYNSIYPMAADRWADFFARHSLDLIHLLDLNEMIWQKWNGVYFVGTTLWTDAGSDYRIGKTVDRKLSDRKYILSDDANNVRWSYKDHFAEHVRSVAEIDKALAEIRKIDPSAPIVLITHHVPHIEGIPMPFRAPISRKEAWTTRGYYSNLEECIKVWKPDAWVHGHAHNNLAYKVCGVPLFTNALGYGPEQDHDHVQFKPDAYFEV